MSFIRFRILLLPISILYNLVMELRNWLYEKNILHSIEPDIKTISVGNMTVGGTGKTPVVEFLVEALKDTHRIVILSRGYKRRSKGYIMAGAESSAREIGDEPKQFLNKFGTDISVAVCEDRLYAIPLIVSDKPETDLIILDDGYQHRQVNPFFNILLSDYSRPFYLDYLLPAGNLRESRKNANRADVVIVTKCPEKLIPEDMDEITGNVRKYSGKETPVWFMKIHYLDPLPAFGHGSAISDSIILLTGIAQTTHLVNFLSKQYTVLKHFAFPDHHNFSRDEIRKVTRYYNDHKKKKPSVLCTEKDYMRLLNSDLQDILMEYPVFFQPITYKFVHGDSQFREFVEQTLGQRTD